MKTLTELLEAPARAMGIPALELLAIAQRGQEAMYEGGACLFHESTPRQWLGIVMDGEVEIVRGLHGTRTHLATLTEGALVAEGVLLDECAHSTSAYAKGKATKVLQVPRAVLEQLRAANPDLYYRIVARVAQRINDRLRAASDQLADRAAGAPEITSYRTEHDSLGEREIPNSAYYGVQTVRAL
jgi:aspartate ammonia-lyase